MDLFFDAWLFLLEYFVLMALLRILIIFGFLRYIEGQEGVAPQGNDFFLF